MSHYHTSGTGHLYQGRFKSFPVQDDAHLLTVLRYVERNPVRAGLCELAEQWRWGSAWRRSQGRKQTKRVLTPPPVRLPRKWRDHVNSPQTEAELAALRNCIQRGAPFGSDDWTKNSAARLGLQFTLRPRPRTKIEKET